MPKGGSRRIVVIDTCFQICSWIRLGLLYLWQGFPGQKYVCMNHPGGLHMNWKCIPTSACLMCSACAVQLCTDSQSDGSSTRCIYTVICTVYKLPGESDKWHMYTVYDFWLLLDFLHPKIHYGGKRRHAWDNPDTWGMFFLMCDLPKRWFFRSCKIPIVHLWSGTQYCMSKTNAFFTQWKKASV